ncbi:MAG TPA: helix-turn-helix transcriptional regulator [Streptosporangiaceae bacterium]|nr:helix-turn-helix transcriptional regulator [Streptosporangiaceae bacterium]
MDDKNVQRTGAAPDPAEDLIARAREAEPDAPALPGQAGDCAQDAWLEAAFAALPPGVFDPVVLAAVDRLMQDSESVTATARQRLVGGAERGIRWRNRLGGQLEHLLRDRRRTLGLSPRAIAARIGVAAGLIAEIETGAKTIETLPADQVAAWIRLVGLDPGAALTALQRSRPPGGTPPISHGDTMAGFTSDVAHALGESPSLP